MPVFDRQVSSFSTWAAFCPIFKCGKASIKIATARITSTLERGMARADADIPDCQKTETNHVCYMSVFLEMSVFGDFSKINTVFLVLMMKLYSAAFSSRFKLPSLGRDEFMDKADERFVRSPVDADLLNHRTFKRLR
jgi:hypothetical protein